MWAFQGVESCLWESLIGEFNYSVKSYALNINTSLLFAWKEVF